MRTLPIILCAGLLLSGITSVQAATVYKWVDSQGQTHFGSQPPLGLDSERLNTRIHAPAAQAGSSEQAATDGSEERAQKEADREVKRQVAQEQAELETFCRDMRTRLAQLKNNPRLLAEVDGQMVRLSEEERQNRIRETEEKISEFCSS